MQSIKKHTSGSIGNRWITALNQFVRQNFFWLTFFLAIYFVCFFFGSHFYILDKLFGSNLYAWYSEWQKDSDQIVVGRLIKNFENGVFSQFGQLWTPSKSIYYESQFGFAGWALSVVPFSLGFQSVAGIKLMYGIVSLFSAVLMAFITVLARIYISKTSSLILAVAILQPYAVSAFHSIFMVVSFKFLPAIVLFVIIQKNGYTRFRIFLISTFSLLPGLLSGYEYLTLFVSLQLCVIAFFSFRDSWSAKKIFDNFVTILAAAFLSLILALSLHLSQLAMIHGGYKRGLDYMIWDLTVRVGATNMVVDPVFVESLQSNPLSVLDTYLKFPVFLSPIDVKLLSQFTVFTLICLTVVAISFINRYVRSLRNPSPRLAVLNGLGGVWIIGLIGPLTWFLLARPHSFIHVWINNFMWFFPTIPLGLILIIESISLRITEAKNLGGKLQTFPVLAAITVGLVLLSLIYSFLSLRQ